MERRYTRNLYGDPDEVLQLEKLRSHVVSVGGLTVAWEVHEPGWRWSEVVRDVVGTDSCQVRHLGVVIRGRLGVRLDSGVEFELGPGDAFEIPAGHDGWVIGDEPFETIGWSGVRTWIEPLGTLAERVVASLVFTDLVGSTTAARRIGDRAWADVVATLEVAVRDAVGRYHGRVVKMTGDGTLATFDGAARSIRCALDLQRVAADFGLAMRTVVHTGEVELAPDDIRGLAIHEAARMLAIAGPGEVLVSAMTRALASDAGISFEDRGDHELRGLDGVRRLFAVRVERAGRDAAAGD